MKNKIKILLILLSLDFIACNTNVKHKNEQIVIQDKEPQEPKPEEIIEVLANDIEIVLHISTILNTK